MLEDDDVKAVMKELITKLVAHVSILKLASGDVKVLEVERLPGRVVLFKNMLHGATTHTCKKHVNVCLYPAFGHIIGNQTLLANDRGKNIIV